MPYMKKKDELQIAMISDSFVEDALATGWEMFDMVAYLASKSKPIDTPPVSDTIDAPVRRGRTRREPSSDKV